MTPSTQQADAAVITSWFAFFVAHIIEFNAILQMIALILASVASVMSIRYHLARRAKSDDLG